MALAQRRRITGGGDHWPGFVDALSSLLLVIIFLVSMFALAQFFLSNALSGRDAELARLNSLIAELSQSLSMERQANEDLQAELASLAATLADANADRDALAAQVEDMANRLASKDAELAGVSAGRTSAESELEKQKELTQAAQDQVALLNQQIAALRAQLSRLEAALEASEQRDKEQQAVIADLGRRLNVALAQKVAELSGYRSEFFGRLREAIGAYPGIRIEGDRFVVPSEVLFDSGSADIDAQGRREMDKVANILLQVMAKIPSDVEWVLRVDGHTDDVPINTPQYPSNWELSSARALAVVRHLISRGVPADRLAGAGFAEFQPLLEGTSALARQANRRIEFKLTEP